LQIRDAYSIYYGVDTPAEEERQRHIFQQEAGPVLLSALFLFFQAYPNGIDAMPTAWTPREVKFEETKILVSVRKVSSDSFDFRFSDSSTWDVSGSWSITKPQPYSNNYSLEGWTNQRPVSFKTLGELREKIHRSWQR
jgi:hypothetical protein